MTRCSPMILPFAVMTLMSSFVGCATFQMPFGDRTLKASATNPAVEILCFWQHGEGQDPDGNPCKGFLGNILFLSRQSSAPVVIEGDVRIYLYDDHGTTEEQTKPIHQFDFDNASWAVHLGKTPLGPTYSVFVPYTKRGVTEARCTLRVRLKPKYGPTIYSDFSNLPLNGNKKPQKNEDPGPTTPDEASRVAAEAAVASLLRTTTIPTGITPKTTDSATVIHETKDSNRVQQASHEVPSGPTSISNESERIRQLEAMVHQLVHEKNQAKIGKDTNSHQTTAEPARLIDEPTGSNTRIQLQPRRRTGQTRPEESIRSRTRQRYHPLDDEPQKFHSKRRNLDSAMEPEFDDLSNEFEVESNPDR